MDQDKLTVNDNQPLFSREEKMILSKLNEAVSLRIFAHKICRSKRFLLKVESYYTRYTA
jgi:hypothetical protein